MEFNTNGRRQIIEYGLVIALFYITGGSFSYQNYSTQITVFFLVSLTLFVLVNKSMRVDRNSVVSLLIMSAFVMLPGIVFGDKIATYIAIVMQLCIGFFIANTIPLFSFKQKYINVITIFAAISLVGFLVGMIMPSVVYHFPLIDKGEGASVIYYNAYVYVYMVQKGYASLVLMSRNAGICWEPGCYQMFLNLALFLLLESEEKRDRIFHFKFIVLIVTIITTFSTTGYILTVAILLILRKRIMYGNRILVGILLFATIAFVLNYFSAGSVISNKILGELNGTSTQSFSSRLSLEAIPRIFDNCFIGMGFSNWLKYDEAMWNSVIHSFICLGTPFTIMHIVNLYRGSKRISNYNALLFGIIILSSFTETLFWRTLFDTIAFYGFIGIEFSEDGEVDYEGIDFRRTNY